MILDLVVAALLLLGSTFTLLAAVGVVRFPDVLTRLHAAAKAGALGVGIIMIAVAVGLGGPDVALRAAVVITFVLLTAPVAGHAIGRAAYLSKDVELSPETVADEWARRPSFAKEAPVTDASLDDEGGRG